ncbi:hypothetical protein A4X03_0g559 [Tilletia caries]|uniref:F-box domain-containing protein n=1 Tax=Tilletia caries TaxID=13290 RepID=A0A8T8TUF8_9BASI|nr:hypothetical protein A4X03_0g559 [Tilletia caries]
MPSFLETPSASDMQQAHVPDEDAGSVPDEDAGTLATSSAALPNRAAAFSLLDLPNELLFPILDGLDYRALNALRSTCKTLRQILLLPRFDHALFRSGYEDHRDYALGNVIFEHQKRDRFSGLVNMRESMHNSAVPPFPVEVHPILHSLGQLDEGREQQTTSPWDYQQTRPVWLEETATRPPLSSLTIRAYWPHPSMSVDGRGRGGAVTREPNFTVRFLPVNLPFHSPYLRGVSDRIASHFYTGVDLCSPEELAIEVRGRFHGSYLRAYTDEGILRSILRQIFDRPVHWSKATNLGSNITPCVSTVDTGFDVVVLDAGCQIEAYHLRDLVSFKPGSADAIRQVRSIAAAYPDDFPIILQWTGGRTGGHHSAEDFHQPILATYSRIRRNTNISLVTGIGFRSADDLWP